MTDPVPHVVERYVARRVRDGASTSYARCGHPGCWWWASGDPASLDRASARHASEPPSTP